MAGTAAPAPSAASGKPKWAALLKPGGPGTEDAPGQAAAAFPGLGKTQAGNILASLASQPISSSASPAPAAPRARPRRHLVVLSIHQRKVRAHRRRPQFRRQWVKETRNSGRWPALSAPLGRTVSQKTVSPKTRERPRPTRPTTTSCHRSRGRPCVSGRGSGFVRRQGPRQGRRQHRHPTSPAALASRPRGLDGQKSHKAPRFAGSSCPLFDRPAAPRTIFVRFSGKGGHDAAARLPRPATAASKCPFPTAGALIANRPDAARPG